MGRLYNGKCKFCGDTFAARKPTTLLSKMSKHRWKDHSAAMSRRIKAGKDTSRDNPTYQDLVSALQEGPRAALKIYGDYTERQYQHMKTMMDVLEPVLPPVIVASWIVVEAFHDARAER